MQEHAGIPASVFEAAEKWAQEQMAPYVAQVEKSEYDADQLQKIPREFEGPPQ